MAGSTKKFIAEQVLYRLYGGNPDVNSPVQEPDVVKALEQKINSKFKLHHFDTNLPSGETIPESAMIAVYENVAVTSLNNGKSKSTLPIQPISLPKDMGIFGVYSSKYPDNWFIPLRRGMKTLLNADKLLNDMMGFISYEPTNNIVTYNIDLTTLGISTVTMELCVLDISLYSNTERLPIPPDFEETIINELVVQFSGVTPETGLVNSFTNANQLNQQGK